MADLDVTVRLGKKVVLIQLPQSSAVKDLKGAIDVKEGIPPSDQILALRGNVLEDEVLLLDLDTFETSIVQCFDKVQDRGKSLCSATSEPQSQQPKIPLTVEFLVKVLNIERFADDLGLKPFTIALKPRDLVYHVKLAIEHDYRLLVKPQVLQIGSTTLHNGRRISHYFDQIMSPLSAASKGKSVMGSESKHEDEGENVTTRPLRLTYTATLPTNLDADLVQIMVRTLVGKTITINHTNLKDPVHFLKQQIQDKDGTPTWQQRLIFAGKQLQDDKLLSEYGVMAGSTLHLVLRLKGG